MRSASLKFTCAFYKWGKVKVAYEHCIAGGQVKGHHIGTQTDSVIT